MRNGRYPEAYESFLYEFHATRDYFECHELLEEYWKDHAGDGFADVWVGLIQLAVGCYHYRRGNRRGAAMMFRQSRNRLAARQLEELAIDGPALTAMLDGVMAAVERGEPFADLNLPLADGRLLERLHAAAAANGHAWGAPSGTDEALIHRHARRDRSEVIAARAAAAEAKKRRLAD
ncbi:DUF309 domain-containing protein [Paenibacillus glycinis]|uniref:DUF309 domain-containing protein n=1 Tax=Paenibacillus glycinis TaxID=2697035 RepID=A0ABW9XM18_9BACL|nr:DUF309 domain-containing protein [Paenibacillus glycinis]NBD23516.1 DUF309 domain-containing protein [Paenibacillus glycinis]